MAATMKKPAKAKLSPQSFDALWGDAPAVAAEAVASEPDPPSDDDAGDADADPDEQVGSDDPTETGPTAEPQDGDISPEPVFQRFDCPKLRAKADHDRKIEEAKNRYIEASMARASLEADLKSAKKEEKDALELLSKIIDRGPDVLPLIDSSAATAAADVSPDAGRDELTQEDGMDSMDAASPATSTPPDPDAWKAAPTIDLTSHGLKQSIADKLIEAGLDTIGRLEARRADIAQGREKWPKGIGEAKITAIEDAVVSWLTANRDRHAFTTETAKPWEQMSADEQCTFLNARVVQLDPDEHPAAVDGITTFDMSEIDLRETEWETVWQEGRDAYDEEDHPVNCPYPPGEDQDAWLQGWLWQAKHDSLNTNAPREDE